MSPLAEPKMSYSAGQLTKVTNFENMLTQDEIDHQSVVQNFIQKH